MSYLIVVDNTPLVQLAQWMEGTGATPADVARVAGVGYTCAYRWLTGERPVPADRLARIVGHTAEDVQRLRPARGRPVHDAFERADKSLDLAEALAKRGLTRKDVARKLGVTRQAVDYWVTGRVTPPHAVMAWVCTQGG